MAADPQPQEINVLCLVRGDQRFAFHYTDDQLKEVIRTFSRFAANPDLPFTWSDAAILSKQVRERAKAVQKTSAAHHLPPGLSDRFKRGLG